jgi:hypothetical protein
MFLGRSKEGSDETDDCSKGKEANRFEKVELPEYNVLEQYSEKQTASSGHAKDRTRCEMLAVTAEQVAQLAEIDLRLEAA